MRSWTAALSALDYTDGEIAAAYRHEADRLLGQGEENDDPQEV